MSDWPHQTYAVSETLRRLADGETAVCVTSPTGGGKSRVMQRLCESFTNDRLQTVVMSNRILLTTQLLRGLDSAGVNVGCRAAGFEAWSKIDAPVQIISGQTEMARVLNSKRIDRGELFPAKRLLIDEAHLQKGDSYLEIIKAYKENFGASVVGITATPLGIGNIYGSLIVAGNTSQLRACGALVPAYCYEPAVVDMPKVRKSKTGMFSQEELEESVRAIWSQHIVGHVFEHWRKLNPDARPSLGMAPGVKESLGLATEYWKRGVNAAHIDAEGIFVDGSYKRTNEQADRDELFAMAKDGRVKQIWNRFVLREAIDLPWLWMLQLATPIAKLTSYLQVVGRVLRNHPSKPDGAIIVDHCGAIRMHGSPNVDRDQDWKQYFHEQDESKITKDRFERMTNPQTKEPEPITCPNCGAIRNSGAKCHRCGHEHSKSVRMVIQEAGTLKPVSGDVYHKRRVTQKPDTQKKWEQCFFRMKNAKTPKTFSQVRALFIREHHYSPPETLPWMPKNPADWSRRIKDVPREELYQRSGQ